MDAVASMNAARGQDVTVTVRETALVCLPERALWIPSIDTLVVADLHWGKAAAFRAAHVPIPMGTTEADLSRLTQALTRTGVSRLLILGDLLHAESGWHSATASVVDTWRTQHEQLRITLVRGNHDRHAGDPPASLNITCVDGPYPLGPFLGVHEPDAFVSDSGYVLAGHLHPCVTLRGRGRQSIRLPAFVFGISRAVIPAFSSFTGSGMYHSETGDRLFAIAGDEVIPISSA